MPMATVGDRIQTAVAKRKARDRRFNMRRLADEAGVGYSWLRSVATDNIKQPDARDLQKVAGALGLDYRELLALSDQLGEIEALPVAAPSSATDIARLAAAIEAQTAAINALAVALGRSAVDRPAWVDDAIAEVQDAVLGARLLGPTHRGADERAHTAPPRPGQE